MIRKLLAGAVAACTAIALTFALTLAPVTARDTAAKPALWKIDGPNGDVYLFGSIHILPPGLQWRRPELDAALQEAERITFEVDIDAVKDPAALMPIIGKYGLLPPDQSLRKMLAPDYRTMLDKVATEYGLQPANLDRMRPWFVAITLSAIAITKQVSKGKPVTPGTMAEIEGVDGQLWAWSKTAGKERGALETAEDQIRVFADLPNDQQIEFLVATLKQISEPPQALDKMIEAWKNGEIAKLDASLNGELKPFPGLHKALFHDRHAKWLPQIEQLMGDGRDHVIVVGAAHLVGEGSVVALLRAKGVKVEGP